MAVGVVSLLSLIGIFAISLRKTTLDRILFFLLSFSAGSILGVAFLDLLPEAIELFIELFGLERISVMIFYVTFGFLSFFFLERFVYWFHGHFHGYDAEDVHEKINVKRFVYLNLIGDSIHNLVDGMIIAGSFLISTTMGVASTIAVIFHELPQEIGDFGVLVYGGLSRQKALFFNFLSALMAFLGIFIVYYLSTYIGNFVGVLIAIGAGGFTYLAASELIPEIQKEEDLKRSIFQFILFLSGVIMIWGLGIIFVE
jgi:zinc and cadmium transporter